MNSLINRIGAIRLTPRRFFGSLTAILAITLSLLSLSSCTEDIDVQQAFPFKVEVMPYPDKVIPGQTIELRLEIKPEGNYSNTLYTIRYFQYDGTGMLKMVDGPVLVNNDRVLLERKQFRLNYTARTIGSHKFLVVIEDNFGSTPWEKTFEFNTQKISGEDGFIIAPNR